MHCQTHTQTTVDSNTGVGQYSSIAIGTDGYPIMSYFDSKNGDLKVVKCGNSACRRSPACHGSSRYRAAETRRARRRGEGPHRSRMAPGSPSEARSRGPCP